ncbi:MAG: hypothetical protein JSV38_05365, partial [Desulfobacterales bacterium]
SSFSEMNLTFAHPNWFAHGRAAQLRKLWLDPTNLFFNKDLLGRYNVTYIFGTADVMEQRLPVIGESGYELKPYHPSQYITILAAYPFLSLVYRQGNSFIYFNMKTIVNDSSARVDNNCPRRTSRPIISHDFRNLTGIRIPDRMRHGNFHSVF